MNQDEIPKPGSYWKHFKGGEYKVLKIAKDCNDPSKLFVVYEGLHGETWIRSLTDFMGYHQNGQKRFYELV
jgi:hypothetical protein